MSLRLVGSNPEPVRYYAIYVNRYIGCIDGEPEWDFVEECLLGAEMTLSELKRSYRIALYGTSRDDLVSVRDETDHENPVAVPYDDYKI